MGRIRGRVATGIVLASLGGPLQAGGLLHQWTFNGWPSDSVGSAHGTLGGNATIEDGRLHTDGLPGSIFLTRPLGESIGAKTLVAWTSPANTVQKGGSVLTIEDNSLGDRFDAIVLGERVDAQWMAGSEFWNRSVEDNLGFPETVVDPDEVMIAIAYGDDGTIAIYRNGELYADPAAASRGALLTFPDSALVQIGPRHGTNPAVYDGWIDEARIYAGVLDAAEIADLWDTGPETAPNEEPPSAETALVHQWTFNDDTADDAVAGAHGVLEGGAWISDGRLHLDGGRATRLLTAALGETLGPKTLVAWVSPANTFQKGGSVLTIEDGILGDRFDAIVLGERVDAQWMAGSEFWNRSVENNLGIPESVVDPEEVMVAIAYGDDNSIAIYRDGELYADPAVTSKGTLVWWPPSSVVQIGARHGTDRESFEGSIDEARIYAGALDAEAIADLYVEGPAARSRSTIVRDLTPDAFGTGETVAVTLTIAADPPNSSFAIREVLPDQAEATEISDGGILVQGRIEWTLTGITSKALSYKLAPTSCAGALRFGRSSFTSTTDGSQGSVEGETAATRTLAAGELGEWASADVGAAGGGAEPLGEHAILVKGVGAGIALAADGLRFVHVPASGEFALSARIDCADDPEGSGLGGLMVRDSLDPSSAHAFLGLEAGDGSGSPPSLRGIFRATTSPAALATELALSREAVDSLPIHLRLAREGGRLTFSRSGDGIAWEEVASLGLGPEPGNLRLGEGTLLGLAATSGGAPGAWFAFGAVSGPEFGGATPARGFRRGDANADGTLNITDGIFVLNYLFLGGPDPPCVEAANANDDPDLNITDGIFTLNYLFLGGTAPPDPGPTTCGEDAPGTPSLGCIEYPEC